MSLAGIVWGRMTKRTHILGRYLWEAELKQRDQLSWWVIKPGVNAKKDERMGLISEEFLVNSSGLFNDQMWKNKILRRAKNDFCVSSLVIRMDKGTIIWSGEYWKIIFSSAKSTFLFVEFKYL